jgi:hypothetical protein
MKMKNTRIRKILQRLITAILPINKIQKDINDKKNKEGIITQKTKIFLHGITALVQRQ